MHRLTKAFVVAALLAGGIYTARANAQPTRPGTCERACHATYVTAVRACAGDPECLAAARRAAVACVRACQQ
jgi:hypothetical protein